MKCIMHFKSKPARKEVAKQWKAKAAIEPVSTRATEPVVFATRRKGNP